MLSDYTVWLLAKQRAWELASLRDEIRRSRRATRSHLSAIDALRDRLGSSLISIGSHLRRSNGRDIKSLGGRIS